MVDLLSLWLPVLLSGIAVFFLSFFLWMVMPHHRNDWGKLPDEDGTLAQLGAIPRGQYMFPHAASPEAMKDPAWIARRDAGPSGLLVVAARGPMNMGKAMFVSFLFNVVVSAITAYVASIALPRGVEPMTTLRLVGTVAVLAYSAALGWGSIWFHQRWATTFRSMLDGVVYGLATGAIFAFCWPGA